MQANVKTFPVKWSAFVLRCYYGAPMKIIYIRIIIQKAKMNLMCFLLVSVFLNYSAGNQKLPYAEIQTSLGKIVLEVDTVRAPVTAKNFLAHITKGTYEGASFYRAVHLDNQPGNEVKIEVIQGGLFADELINKFPAVKHETTQETGLKHVAGAISMARNEPGSASTEFFICIGDQPDLDFGGKRNPDGQGFAVFGSVISGMEVVRQIQQLPEEGQYLIEPVVFKAVIKKE
jgi:peptidyl-prolyl cis-trans isomerase A (cyclophilin A)